MTGKLILEQAHYLAMIRHARRCAPLEACGLLAGKGEQVLVTLGIPNAERSPVRFSMEPRAQWRAFQRFENAGLELLGIYHSHPNGPAFPSTTDIALALYPVTQVILCRAAGKWSARAFLLQTSEVSELTLEIRSPSDVSPFYGLMHL
jgi:[CysO sulfur-carrier protein]-S-L-cysteine hydrolase